MIVIEPGRPAPGFGLPELWAYRELLLVLVSRNIHVRYKQTVLGIAWAVIQPVMLMVVFSMFFGRLARIPSDGFPYPVFVYTALVPWTFFAGTLGAAANSLINSAGLVRKVYFPRLLLPLATAGTGLVDFAIATVVLLMIMAYYGYGLGVQLLMFPILVASLILTTLGAGTLLAALAAAYRDFRYVVSFLVQVWLFATPVIYPASLVPADWRWVLYLNPMAGIIQGFRACFLGLPFDYQALAISLGAAVVMFAAGVAYFRGVERRFADII